MFQEYIDLANDPRTNKLTGYIYVVLSPFFNTDPIFLLEYFDGVSQGQIPGYVNIGRSIEGSRFRLQRECNQ